MASSPLSGSESKASFDPGAAAQPGSGIYGLPFAAEESAVLVVPVPFDATASYRKGAWRGPDALLRASRQVDLFDVLTGRPYEAGIHMLEADPRIVELQREASDLADRVIAAAGDVTGDPRLVRARERVNQIGEIVNRSVERSTREILDQEKLPVIVGGDHSVPFGAIQACAERFPGLGVLHVDAHADLRVAYEGFEWSHASILHNVATKLGRVAKIVQVGIRDLSEEEHDAIRGSGGRIVTLFDRDWADAKLSGGSLRELVRAHLAHLPSNVYLSVDIDGLDPALCPNTGTPVPGGLAWAEALLWLEELGRSGKRVVGLDLNEVNPGETAGDQDSWDAMVGARLLYRMIGIALGSRGARPAARRS